MAGITFNDGTGSVTLRGVFAAPFDRFRNFAPTVMPVGPTVTRLSDGARSLWEYRTDHLVSLQLPYILARVYGGESGTARAQRLMLHLMRGGAVDVLVEDGTTAANSCRLAEGSTPTLELEDPRVMSYTFAATFRSGTRFTALYGGLAP
jgi:hypothetical protein